MLLKYETVIKPKRKPARSISLSFLPQLTALSSCPDFSQRWSVNWRVSRMNQLLLNLLLDSALTRMRNKIRTLACAKRRTNPHRDLKTFPRKVKGRANEMTLQEKTPATKPDNPISGNNWWKDRVDSHQWSSHCNMHAPTHTQNKQTNADTTKKNQL